MPITSEQVKGWIKDLATNPSHKETLKVVKDNLPNLNKGKSAALQEGFAAAYNEGIDCEPFQKHLDKISKEQKIKPPLPNLMEEYTSNWMSKLPKNKKLTGLILPGTHDSGAGKLSPKAPGFFSSFPQKLKFPESFLTHLP